MNGEIAFGSYARCPYCRAEFGWSHQKAAAIQAAFEDERFSYRCPKCKESSPVKEFHAVFPPNGWAVTHADD